MSFVLSFNEIEQGLALIELSKILALKKPTSCFELQNRLIIFFLEAYQFLAWILVALILVLWSQRRF